MGVIPDHNPFFQAATKLSQQRHGFISHLNYKHIPHTYIPYIHTYIYCIRKELPNKWEITELSA